MDSLTHALLGATAAHALGRAQPQTHARKRPRLRARERMLLGAAAGTFPDIDFLGFMIQPLVFLADWHQGPTHSIVLLPLWAALIGAAFVGLTRQGGSIREATAISAVGLASHVLADVITAYGTAVLYPLSHWRLGLGTTFMIDPSLTAIVLAGLASSLWSGRRLHACVGLAVSALYVAAQAGLQQHALHIARGFARDNGLAIERMAALAQPFSPFNWKLVGSDDTRHFQAHVNLVGHPPLVPAWPALERLHQIASAYRPPPGVAWQMRARFGEEPERRELARRLWQDPRFAPFRRFAVYPSVSQTDDDHACVWFTDLRYDLPALPDTFRYGFCRDSASSAWQLYRLRYLSARSRQRIEP